MYSYHLLFTGSDFLAAIGGYLGLFLGLSVYGLIELLEKFIQIRDAIKIEEAERKVSVTQSNGDKLACQQDGWRRGDRIENGNPESVLTMATLKVS